MTDPTAEQRNPIVRWPDPVLARPAQAVESFDVELGEFLDALKAAMQQHRGVGLAAPQVGVSLRVAVAIRRPSGLVVELVNPTYTKVNMKDLRVSLDEACLSVPGLSHRVKRLRRVVLTWQDRHGAKYREVVDGDFAHVVQHEIDHLAGRVYLDSLPAAERAAAHKHMEHLAARDAKRAEVGS